MLSLEFSINKYNLVLDYDVYFVSFFSKMSYLIYIDLTRRNSMHNIML